MAAADAQRGVAATGSRPGTAARRSYGMPLLVLSAPDVHRLLGYPDCVAAMRAGLLALAAGRAEQPLRSLARRARRA